MTRDEIAREKYRADYHQLSYFGKKEVDKIYDARIDRSAAEAMERAHEAGLKSQRETLGTATAGISGLERRLARIEQQLDDLLERLDDSV